MITFVLSWSLLISCLLIILGIIFFYFVAYLRYAWRFEKSTPKIICWLLDRLDYSIRWLMLIMPVIWFLYVVATSFGWQ